MHYANATALEVDSSMTLNQVKVGCDVRVQSLQGDECERLREMGFCEQLRIKKLSDGRNLICSLCGTRLAISRELANQVLVSPL